MFVSNARLRAAALAVALVLVSCGLLSTGAIAAKQKSKAAAPKMKVSGESLVLAKQIPGKLCFDNVVPGSIVVRSTYLPNLPNTVKYEQGRDYVVDYTRGTIARSPASRIPDYSTNMLYGKVNFDHTKFPGFSNNGWFVFVDYQTRSGWPFTTPSNQAPLLQKTRAKLVIKTEEPGCSSHY